MANSNHVINVFSISLVTILAANLKDIANNIRIRAFISRFHQEGEGTYCKVNNRNSAISSTNHSGNAAKAFGMSEGNGKVGQSMNGPAVRTRIKNSPTVV